MGIFLRILIFVAAIALGTLILRYTDYLVRLAGKSETAEQYAWMWGGTYLLWKIIAISMLCFGVLFAILLGYVTVLAVQSLTSPLNNLANEWMNSILTEEIDGDRIHELQTALIQKATPWKVASHVFGWLSLVSFFVAVSAVAVGLK